MNFPISIGRKSLFQILGVLGGIFHFYLNSYRAFYDETGDPDQTPRSVASDLGLRCLPMSHKKDARLTWVKSRTSIYFNVIS